MAANNGPTATMALETLLFKATNPANKLEDVNTIKQFCDAVNATPEGPAVACRILAHKIQSPQEREAVQALAVLEACAKSCGPAFHAEMGKFKFLNEMIKLVSPRYLAGRTPEHIKKKVIELLYVWSTKDLKSETKVVEAYNMLKKQGIVKEDPVYVGGAVFAAALPPRNDAVMNAEQQKELRKLLQSKNPDDLQKANKIIKSMVKEDERKMDALTRRATELTMVNNNSKLLHEMLDHYDHSSCGREERELLKELFQSCEKMQPKLFRLAAESDEHDEGIGEILQASDDIARVIDRYKMVIVQGKPDIAKPLCKQHSDQLLDLDASLADSDSFQMETEKSKLESVLLDDVMIGLGSIEVATTEKSPEVNLTKNVDTLIVESLVDPSISPNMNGNVVKSMISIDDLLSNSSESISTPPIVLPTFTSTSSTAPSTVLTSKVEEAKSSRVRGLDELNFLGENALRAHLPQKSPQFAKKNDKLPMNLLQKKKNDFPKSDFPKLDFPKLDSPKSDSPKSEPPKLDVLPSVPSKTPNVSNNVPSEVVEKKSPSVLTEDVRIADLFVPLTTIKPGSTPPLTLQESSDGISIVLHFGKDQPREHVSPIVITVISKFQDPVTNFELKAVVPKGCKVKLQPPSSDQLPAHNPFVPPSAITQVMLISNPQKKTVGLKYVISYMIDGEPQTEMGETEKLPI